MDYFTARPGGGDDPLDLSKTIEPPIPVEPVVEDNPYGDEEVSFGATPEPTGVTTPGAAPVEAPAFDADNPYGDGDVSAEPSTLDGVAAGISRGTAQSIGLVQDVTKIATDGVDHVMGGLTGNNEPFIGLPSGTETVVSLFNDLGMGLTTEQYFNLPHDAAKGARFGNIFASSATLGSIPIIAGAKPLTAAVFLGRQSALADATIGGAIRRTGQNIMESARNNPKTFAFQEASASAGAAQGDFIAQEAFGATEQEAVWGQIAGGVFNPIGLTYSMLGKGGKGVFNLARGFGPSGAKRRAGDYLTELLVRTGEKPEDIIKMINLTEAQAGIPRLTTGLETGSPVLIALEKTLAQRSAQFAGHREEAVLQNFQSMRESIETLIQTGDPAALAKAAQLRMDYFDTLLSGRIAEAQHLAADAVSRLPAGTPNRVLSETVFDASKQALREARATESAFWDEVPKNVIVTQTSGLESAVMSAQQKMVREDIFPFSQTIRSVLDGDVATSTGELINLRSRLLSEARDLRGQSKWRDAKILDELADGILTDLTSMDLPVMGTARDFSRMLNDTFSRTWAGRTMRVDETGAERISPELTLERAFGSGGTQGNQRMRELNDAADFGDRAINANAQINKNGIPIGQALGADVYNAQEQFIGQMAQQTVKDGIVDPAKLAKFLETNSEMLERFPELRGMLDDAGKATQTLNEVTASAERATKAIQSRTIFGKIISTEDPTKAIKIVMSGNNPAKELGQLARMAKAEATRSGNSASIDGLRASVLDWAVGVARGKGGVDYQKLSDTLYNPTSRGQKSPMQIMTRDGIITNTQREMFERVVTRGAEIQKAMNTGRGLDELGQDPDFMFDLALRISGARVGAQLGQGTGGGALVIAGATSRAARTLFEKVPATKVMEIVDASMRDPRLASELLKRGRSPKQAAEDLIKMEGYLIDAGLIDRSEHIPGGDGEQEVSIGGPIRAKNPTEVIVPMPPLSQNGTDFTKTTEALDNIGQPEARANLWAQNYQGTGTAAKVSLYLDKVNELNGKAPKEAEIRTISRSVAEAFAADVGMIQEDFAKTLYETSLVESHGGRDLRQNDSNPLKGPGPGRGWWQLEVATVKNMLKTSGNLLGPAADKILAKDGLSADQIRAMSTQALKDLLVDPSKQLTNGVLAGLKWAQSIQAAKKREK